MGPAPGACAPPRAENPGQGMNEHAVETADCFEQPQKEPAEAKTPDKTDASRDNEHQSKRGKRRNQDTKINQQTAPTFR